MRNFRTAAVASATALTVLAGGTAIASAQDADATETASKDEAVVSEDTQERDKGFGEIVSDGTEGLFGGKGSSQYFDDKDEPFYPTDAFGNKTNKEDVPQWARYWIDGSIVAAIGALVGLVIAGLNFSFYNGWLQHPLSR
mgnify:FL=1